MNLVNFKNIIQLIKKFDFLERVIGHTILKATLKRNIGTSKRRLMEVSLFTTENSQYLSTSQTQPRKANEMIEVSALQRIQKICTYKGVYSRGCCPRFPSEVR